MKHHRLDPFSLVFGISFAALGLGAMIGHWDVTNWKLPWIWPLPIIAIGLLIVVMAARSGRQEPSTPPGSSSTDPGTEA
jgi:hypothetical protein